MHRYFISYTETGGKSLYAQNFFYHTFLDLDHEITKKDLETFEKKCRGITNYGFTVLFFKEIPYEAESTD